jgi:hypothetical protein
VLASYLKNGSDIRVCFLAVSGLVLSGWLDAEDFSASLANVTRVFSLHVLTAVSVACGVCVQGVGALART